MFQLKNLLRHTFLIDKQRGTWGDRVPPAAYTGRETRSVSPRPYMAPVWWSDVTVTELPLHWTWKQQKSLQYTFYSTMIRVVNIVNASMQSYNIVTMQCVLLIVYLILDSCITTQVCALKSIPTLRLFFCFTGFSWNIPDTEVCVAWSTISLWLYWRSE